MIFFDLSFALKMNTYNLFEAISENDLAKVMTFSDFNIDHMFEAARQGKLQIMMFLHSQALLKQDPLATQGCEWDAEICECAARNGHLECLRYAHENGCGWNKLTCLAAAENGHIDCLRYAHENGCEWDKEVCLSAAREGHIDCLRYAHENGCEWDESVSLTAIEFENIECILYVISNGCPIDEAKCLSLLIESEAILMQAFLLSLNQSQKHSFMDCITCLIERSKNLQALLNKRSIKFDLIAEKIDITTNPWSRFINLNLSKHPKLQSKVR